MKKIIIDILDIVLCLTAFGLAVASIIFDNFALAQSSWCLIFMVMVIRNLTFITHTNKLSEENNKLQYKLKRSEYIYNYHKDLISRYEKQFEELELKNKNITREILSRTKAYEKLLIKYNNLKKEIKNGSNM